MLGADHLHRPGLAAALLGLPRSDRAERALREVALEALESLGVADAAERPAGELAFGVAKRVALARALVARPVLVMLDEPAGGLGADDVEELAALIRRLRESMSVMLVEHRMDLVMSVCDHVAVLDSGRLIAAGAPEEVKADPRVLEAYLGAEDDVRLGLAHVPEGGGVIAELTVEENLRLGALWRRDRRDRAAAMAEVYDLFPRLEERRRLAASSLSGGERQMLSIGRALMGRPTMLLLDEPSLGLAPIIVERIMAVIADLRERT